MSSFYLVEKNKRNNKVRIIKESERLEEIDYYTVDYHNRHSLSKAINKEALDTKFFIVKSIVKGNKTYLETMDVLYSDSKEIKMIMGSKESVNNLINHFYDKMQNDLDFYDMVINKDANIYPRFKKYFTQDIISNPEDLKTKDGGWITNNYELLRNMVSSFSRYERQKRSKKSNTRRLIERLILEKRLISKIDEYESPKQLNFFDKIKQEIDDNKLLEVMCVFRHLPYGFLEIKDRKVRMTNNLITTYENLNKLDSLLDQRIGYALYEYLESRYNYGQALDKESENKYKNLVIKKQREMIDVLMSDASLLNDTYKWSLIISINKDRLLGDYNGKVLYK